jgi:sulfur carrier protein
MKIFLNGVGHEAPERATVLTLLERAGVPAGRVAVEVNGSVVRREQFPLLELRDRDRVEVVHFVGGG